MKPTNFDTVGEALATPMTCIGQGVLLHSDKVKLDSGAPARATVPAEDHFTLHTSFFIIKKAISLCYGLGMDMVHPDFPFQSIREKEFQKMIKGTSLFCHLASQVTKSCSADALDSQRCVRIGNDPLVSKVATPAERSIHGLEAAGKVHFSSSLR